MAGARKADSRPAGARSAYRYVAFLRGINVGGKNKLSMADLAGIFAAAGCTDVRTYIQSGNVVFSAGARVAGRVADVVARGITEKFGYRVPVVMRSAAELRRAAKCNPFLKSGVDEKSLHVAFLAQSPSKALVAALDPERSPGDSFAVRGREVYLHLPNGVARTKLTNAYLDATLGTVSTVRNWRTVLKLVGMV